MSWRSPGKTWPGDRVRQPRGFETVTVTYRYGDSLRSLVARDAPTAHAQARRRFGDPDAVASLSTPTTILNDLTGETARRSAAKGLDDDFGARFWPRET